MTYVKLEGGIKIICKLNLTMRYSRIFKRTLFSEAVIRKIVEMMESKAGRGHANITLAISREDHKWDLDTIDEFFEEYNHGFSRMRFHQQFGHNHEIDLSSAATDHDFEASITSPDKSDIQEVIAYLVEHLEDCNIDKIYNSFKKPFIFIGHGRKNDWKDLRDHLRDKHSYSLRFYESCDRSGGYLFDNVNEMITGSKISILVLTNDDIMKDDSMRARQNVIHELGMAQVIHGIKNTLAVIEEGCDWPSNIQGIDCFPYTKSIREINGDIVSALEKRMFELFSRER